ncbi:MAG: hypothetical protein M1470_00485 [Bacteroidetes bacterium]|nr:hypothetical protein [Bacteroidota bacterium]MCL5739132.1 hypothetical protein [Bacteroidota bacterium]
MKEKIAVLFLVMLFPLTACRVLSQTTRGYDPHKVFDPNFDANGGTIYRSASGAPGLGYWQNRADYKIAATLDTTSKMITGQVDSNFRCDLF